MTELGRMTGAGHAPGRTARPGATPGAKPAPGRTAGAGPGGIPAQQALRLGDVHDRHLLSETTAADDPDDVYSRLRERWGPVAPVDLEPGVPAWLVLGHAEVVAVMRDDRTFVKDPSTWRGHDEELLGPHSGLRPLISRAPQHTAIHQDGAEHMRLRAPIDDALEQVDEIRTAVVVRRLCTMLIQRFERRGRADLVAEYAAAVPFLVMSELAGYDPEDAQRIQEIIQAIFDVGPDARDLRKELGGIVRTHLARSAERGTTDIAGVLARHPAFQDDLERAQTLIALTSIASTSLLSWVAQTLTLVLTDERFSNRLRGGRLNIDDALDEVLWRSTPNPNMVPRYATRDVLLDDKLIERGDAVVMSVHAANHDPAILPDDQWEEIGNRAHLSFGGGPHTCPAPRLARVIARIAAETLVRRLHVTFDGDPADLEWAPSPWLRYPARLPVTFPVPRRTDEER
ncbi:cytochrome P450 [Myceligenerans pegani]|uniref:Cytochrome P450 n=1 Tax=Myceligenerans pegani TaxID=2776917 RepID=A0ABR9N3I7_9MICO|nr:cytochrome P450 [Myceligenerans sp. TRM 65318]MBE1877689.1 cytochrome P450 [Myceligenerans sp. TRM 65318]MBE3019960.1 cytochrome P450 [Myceligenerans sp. TRM 65318]